MRKSPRHEPKEQHRKAACRVVLDTNVLVSAFLNPDGTPAHILRQVVNGNLLLCYDSRLIAEYERVLSRLKFKIDKMQSARLLDLLMADGLSVVPESSDVFFPDESDRKFYDAALSCRALLITGNLKHYPRESRIMTPSNFLKNEIPNETPEDSPPEE